MTFNIQTLASALEDTTLPTRKIQKTAAQREGGDVNHLEKEWGGWGGESPSSGMGDMNVSVPTLSVALTQQ